MALFESLSYLEDTDKEKCQFLIDTQYHSHSFTGFKNTSISQGLKKYLGLLLAHEVWEDLQKNELSVEEILIKLIHGALSFSGAFPQDVVHNIFAIQDYYRADNPWVLHHEKAFEHIKASMAHDLWQMQQATELNYFFLNENASHGTRQLNYFTSNSNANHAKAENHDFNEYYSQLLKEKLHENLNKSLTDKAAQARKTKI